MKHTVTVEADARSARKELDQTQQHEQSYLFEYRRQIRGLLAMIRAIVRRTARKEQSIEAYAALLEGRLGALARVQDMLMRVPKAGADLLELVSAEFLAQGVPEDRFTMTGGSVQLTAKVGASLALALHELTTNAIRFGALSTAQGHVCVSWHEDDSGFTRVEWRESGVSILLTSPRTSGFGMELLEKTLPYELRARTSVDLAAGGLTCVIEFPH
ncbi:MAG: sensor histidine kinase [Sinobacteraceae bacterium]|nr:sensor histidine kinase [Nevskiaceae bacterium]